MVQQASATTIADSYQLICQANLPDLSEAEWHTVMQALNGYLGQEAGKAQIEFAIYSICDAIDEAFGYKVDVDELRSKLRAMDFAQKVALVDAAERFWAQDRSVAEFIASIESKPKTSKKRYE